MPQGRRNIIERRGLGPTNRWTRAAGACFSTCLVRRCLNEFAPPRQLNRYALAHNESNKNSRSLCTRRRSSASLLVFRVVRHSKLRLALLFRFSYWHWSLRVLVRARTNGSEYRPVVCRWLDSCAGRSVIHGPQVGQVLHRLRDCTLASQHHFLRDDFPSKSGS